MRWRARFHQAADADEAPEFWVAYSDLLVSLMMVFALLLFLALSKIQHEVRLAQEVGESIAQVLRRGQEALEGTGTGIRLDSASKAITLDAEVLFKFGSATLQPQATVAISNVATKFIPAVLADSAVAPMLEAIVIEGHTDTVGTYLTNLQLSQARAHSVMEALIAAAENKPYEDRLKQLLVASGRSEVEPIRDPDGRINARLSRRIEIHFRTRDDILLNRIFEQVSGKVDK